MGNPSYFLYPDDDPDHSKNLMGYKLDTSDFFSRRSNYPVNIRNVFKWFKHLRNVFKTYLNTSLWFSEHFQVNIYTECLRNAL